MNKDKLPFVSIIIPCRNEEKFIKKCLDSILWQNYLKNKIEVLVIDGMSNDKTRSIIKEYSKKYHSIQLLINKKITKPFALNIGIEKAKGEITMIMDAHAGYKKNYVSKCVETLIEYNADNIGGILKTIPRENTISAKAIVTCLSGFFGVGGSHFRKGLSKIKEVDTVFGGCYQKDVFKKIGLFNENLVRSQDMELNIRLKKAGGKIILNPDIISYYYPKSTLKEFFIHNIQDGIWSIYPLKFVKLPFKARHYIPLIFVLYLTFTGLLGIFYSFSWFLFSFIIILYLLLNLFFSINIAYKEKNIKYLILMPITFACRHFGYAMGALIGLIKLSLK